MYLISIFYESLPCCSETISEKPCIFIISLSQVLWIVRSWNYKVLFEGKMLFTCDVMITLFQTNIHICGYWRSMLASSLHEWHLHICHLISSPLVITGCHMSHKRIQNTRNPLLALYIQKDNSSICSHNLLLPSVTFQFL